MIRTPKCLGLLIIVTALAAVSFMSPAQSQAYPEPAIVPSSWDLNVTYSTPKAIAVKDIAGKTRWYWYVTYKVVNHTGQDQLFVPEVEIATDAGDLVRSGQNVPTAVFFNIKNKLGNSLLESPNQIVGKLLQGEDFARESLIVWPAFDHDITNLSIFFAGLSGEISIIKQPMSGDSVIMRKVLMINYTFPGDAMTTSTELQTVLEDGKRWIMR